MTTTLKLFALTTLTCLLLGCSSQKNQTGSDNQRPGGQPGTPPSFAQLLQEMDTNNDGKLAQAEVTGHLAKDFDNIDSNADGFLSQAELKKAPRPQRAQSRRL